MMLGQLWATTAANSPTPPLDVSQIKMYFFGLFSKYRWIFCIVMYFDAKCIIIFCFVIMCEFKNFHWSSDNIKVMQSDTSSLLECYAVSSGK